MRRDGTYGWLRVVRLLVIFGSFTLFGIVGCGNRMGCNGTADGDGDGIAGAADNCPNVANPDQADSDGDGIGDACDEDVVGSGDPDGDGVLNANDNCRFVINPDQEDADGDGVGDACDNCPDDANPANAEATDCNSDGDTNDPGERAGSQCDRDEDGVGDTCDNAPDTPNTDQADGDGDGVGDVADNCPNDANPDQADLDSDGVGDACEGDRDGDGVPDANDNCLSANNPNQEDADGDGVGDACDNAPNNTNPNQEDGDGDGVGDIADNCPDDFNPAPQADADDDGVGDVCDNCPNKPNGPDAGPNNQVDTDNDGVGDVCEGDRDSDGVDDNDDNCPNKPNGPDAGPNDQVDTDNDGVGDACDNCPDKANGPDAGPNDQVDTDGDGLGDVCDTGGGGGSGTPPLVPVVISIGNPVQNNVLPCTDNDPNDGKTGVSLTATCQDPAQCMISWSQFSGPQVSLNDDSNGTVVANLGPQLREGDVVVLRATGTANGRAAIFVDATITIAPFTSMQVVGTKSSGAAQPGDEVELDLADGEDPNWQVLWTQAADDAGDAVTITPADGNTQVATFVAPSEDSTVDLNFTARGCGSGALLGIEMTGTLAVPIQVATIDSFNLPASINVNEVIDLDTLIAVSGISVNGLNGVVAPNGDADLLFFVLAEDGGALPGDVTAVFVPPPFQITAAPANTTILVRVQVISTAGGPGGDQLALASAEATTVVAGGGN